MSNTTLNESNFNAFYMMFLLFLGTIMIIRIILAFLFLFLVYFTQLTLLAYVIVALFTTKTIFDKIVMLTYITHTFSDVFSVSKSASY